MWGAAPRSGREKFSLHPRHVCDVPKDDRKPLCTMVCLTPPQGRSCISWTSCISCAAFWFSKKSTEAQGMGTVVRPAGPNGEVPSPLRSFVSSWKCAAIKQKPVAEATGEKWWWVYDSNVGRQSQRIYSPPQLATLVTHRKTPHSIANRLIPRKPFFAAGTKKPGVEGCRLYRSECAHKRPRSFHPSPWLVKARDNTACAGWGGVMHA